MILKINYLLGRRKIFYLVWLKFAFTVKTNQSWNDKVLATHINSSDVVTSEFLRGEIDDNPAGRIDMCNIQNAIVTEYCH